MKTNKFYPYWDSLTAKQKIELAENAKTSVAYLSQIANEYRNAGWNTIKKLMAADENIDIEMFS